MDLAPFSCCPHVRFLLLAGLALLAGCSAEEDVRHYTVPQAAAAPPVAGNAAKPMQRLLGGVFTQGDKKWFVKCTGAEADVKEHEAEIDAFIGSFAFKDNADPSWKAPEGWRPGKSTKFSLASFRAGPDDKPVDVTVTPAAGGLLDNVNRWREQLGLAKINEDDFRKTVKEKKLGDVTLLLIDLTGPGGGKMSGRPPFADLAKAPPALPRVGDAPPRPGLKYTTPAGWKEGKQTQFSLRSFSAGEGREAVSITVTALAGPAGGLLPNVNRWREQVGLRPWTAEQFGKESTPFMVAGSPAVLVDLAGAPEGKRIVGAVLSHDEQTWFFKMGGLVDAVGRQKTAFEAFVKSVRFEGDGR